MTFEEMLAKAKRDLDEAIRQGDKDYAFTVVEWVARQAFKMGKDYDK